MAREHRYLHVLPIQRVRPGLRPPLTLKAIDDLYMTWRLIGPELVRIGVQNVSDRQLEAILPLLDEVENALTARSASERSARFNRTSDAIFTELACSTTNDQLVQTYRHMSPAMADVWALALSEPSMPEYVHTSARGWPAVLAARDGALAAETVRAFIDTSCAAAMHSLVLAPASASGQSRA